MCRALTRHLVSAEVEVWSGMNPMVLNAAFAAFAGLLKCVDDSVYTLSSDATRRMLSGNQKAWETLLQRYSSDAGSCRVFVQVGAHTFHQCSSSPTCVL